MGIHREAFLGSDSQSANCRNDMGPFILRHCSCGSFSDQSSASAQCQSGAEPFLCSSNESPTQLPVSASGNYRSYGPSISHIRFLNLSHPRLAEPNGALQISPFLRVEACCATTGRLPSTLAAAIRRHAREMAVPAIRTDCPSSHRSDYDDT